MKKQNWLWEIGILTISGVFLHFGSKELAASGANIQTQNLFAVVVVIGIAFAFFQRSRFKRRQLRRDAEAFGRVAMICYATERGIHKRIDENRELLELLQRESPDLLDRCPWVERWLNSQDIFLFDLSAAVGTKNPVGLPTGRFPRPWPGRNPQQP